MGGLSSLLKVPAICARVALTHQVNKRDIMAGSCIQGCTRKTAGQFLFHLLTSEISTCFHYVPKTSYPTNTGALNESKLTNLMLGWGVVTSISVIFQILQINSILHAHRQTDRHILLLTLLHQIRQQDNIQLQSNRHIQTSPPPSTNNTTWHFWC